MMKTVRKALCASLLVLAYVMCSCAVGGNRSTQETQHPREDADAKSSLQGIWVDRETGTVVFQAKGDSIFYPDTTYQPVRFRIWRDTLFLEGSNVATYPVTWHGHHAFAFHSSTGETVELIRSDNLSDTILFASKPPAPQAVSEVLKKDTVVYYGGVRYHCYVYINPSTVKVYKTTYTDEGIAVENVYFDNVIHICVYQGRDCLYACDYNKRSFAGYVPAGFLKQARLSDIAFDAVDREGFHFCATVCIPDDASCYMVEVCVDFDGEPVMKLIEY